ncbi:MAG TPA: FAD-dependent monooxygenase, partial [Myxococcaceae bacterium]
MALSVMRSMSSPSSRSGEPVLVVGAGLVGSLLSIYLAKLGYPVEVYDRYPDPRRPVEAGEGRPAAPKSALNLTLCTRGMKALDAAGIGQEVRAITLPLRRRVVHMPDGTLESQPYGNQGEALNCVLRGDLNKLLLDLAEKQPGVRVQF